jgi:hypothetical protein
VALAMALMLMGKVIVDSLFHGGSSLLLLLRGLENLARSNMTETHDVQL